VSDYGKRGCTICATTGDDEASMCGGQRRWDGSARARGGVGERQGRDRGTTSCVAGEVMHISKTNGCEGCVARVCYWRRKRTRSGVT
jgi:hypothetical protein